METLAELHELVKNHPYRVNGESKYFSSYQELLYKLSSAFYFAKKETKFKSADVTHDFNCAIQYCGSATYKYVNEAIQHVEYCISVIHTFIDTGEVLEFRTFFPEPNTFKYLGNSRLYKWNTTKNKYILSIPAGNIYLARKEINGFIQSYKDKIASNPTSTHNKYYQDYIEYYTELLELI